MPKFIKSKKEKVPKTKPKKQKVVKPKQKRPKKAAPKLKIPKMPKFKAPKLPKVQGKSPLPKNKKILIIVVAALILVIVGAAAAIILLTMSKKDKKEEAPPEAPAYYFSKDEEISSITAVVGEREFKNLTVIPEEAEKETKKKEKKEKSEENEESKEEKEEKASDKKDDSSKKKNSDEEEKGQNQGASDEKTDKNQPETKEDGAEKTSGDDSEEESAEETTAEEAPVPDEVYQYLHIKDVAADLEAYRAYLENEKNFFDVTEKTAPVAEEAEEKDESKEIYTFAGPSVDENSHLTIILETAADSYTVTARKEDEGWNTYFRQLWDDQKKTIEEYSKKPKATTSIEQAEDTVRSQGEEKLGLPEPTEAYEFIGAPGLSKVDGTNYYRVRTYKKLEDDTLIYMGTYLFDYDTSQVSYKFDEVTGETTPLQ